MKHAPSTLFAILLITAEAASGAVVTQDYNMDQAEYNGVATGAHIWAVTSGPDTLNLQITATAGAVGTPNYSNGGTPYLWQETGGGSPGIGVASSNGPQPVTNIENPEIGGNDTFREQISLIFSGQVLLNSITFEWLGPDEALDMVFPNNSVITVFGENSPYTKTQSTSYIFNPGDALVIRGRDGGGTNAGYISNLNLSVNVVPEPTSMLSTLAFVCSGLMLRRRCKIFVWIGFADHHGCSRWINR
jgi:hypothetical protein